MTPKQKITFSKPPRSFSEQAELLRSYGLNAPRGSKAEFYLAHLNYYRLAAYRLPFEEDHKTHRLRPDTSFEDVLNLYMFDRALRLLMMDAIERIEVSIRTQMAYHLAHLHKTSHPHLEPSIFRNHRYYQIGIRNLHKESAKSNEAFIHHFIEKYEEPLSPIWAVVELMTMGQLSKWFSNIAARKDRQAISAAYRIDERILTSYCEHLSLVRNITAHHARLWNRSFTKTMRLPSHGPASLLESVWVVPLSDPRGRKIYNTLTMTLFVLDVIAPEHDWRRRLLGLIKQHEIDTHDMGFPCDWMQRPLWASKYRWV